MEDLNPFAQAAWVITSLKLHPGLREGVWTNTTGQMEQFTQHIRKHPEELPDIKQAVLSGMSLWFDESGILGNMADMILPSDPFVLIRLHCVLDEAN